MGYDALGGWPIPLIDPRIHRLMLLWKGSDVHKMDEYRDDFGRGDRRDRGDGRRHRRDRRRLATGQHQGKEKRGAEGARASRSRRMHRRDSCRVISLRLGLFFQLRAKDLLRILQLAAFSFAGVIGAHGRISSNFVVIAGMMNHEINVQRRRVNPRGRLNCASAWMK